MIGVTESRASSGVADRRVLLAVLATLVAIVVSNNSAGSLAQPAIGEAFGAGPADVGWIVFGFASAFAVATALWGGIAARSGIGPALAIGVTLFSVGSLASALAPSLPMLVAARIVQGLGAGAIPTWGQSAIALRLEGADRFRALGTIIAAVATGLAAGPLLGGLALELVGWRGPVAFGVIAAPAAVLLAREARARERTGGLDLPGAFLVVVAVLGLTFSVNRLPVDGFGAPTYASLALLAGAFPLLVRRSTRPGSFVPLRIVGDPAFRRVVFQGALGSSAFLGTLVLNPARASCAAARHRRRHRLFAERTHSGPAWAADDDHHKPSVPCHRRAPRRTAGCRNEPLSDGARTVADRRGIRHSSSPARERANGCVRWPRSADRPRSLQPFFLPRRVHRSGPGNGPSPGRSGVANLCWPSPRRLLDGPTHARNRPCPGLRLPASKQTSPRS